MDPRPAFFVPAFVVTAAFVAMLAAPAVAWSAGEPVATAPIPPPPQAEPAKPMFVPPNLPANKTSTAKPAADAPKNVETPKGALKHIEPKTGEAPKTAEAARTKTKTAARPHRGKRAVAVKTAADAKRDMQQQAAKNSAPPPVARRPAPRPHVYAGAYPRGAAMEGPAYPPPWYGGPPLVDYPPPWRRGPPMPW
jgi:hypothetical protein